MNNKNANLYIKKKKGMLVKVSSGDSLNYLVGEQLALICGNENLT